MFNWLRRRKLSAGARKRLLLVVARAEDALIETHVANILDLLDSLSDEVDIDRGIELYLEAVSLDEQTAASVTNRLLARIDEEGDSLPERDEGRFRNIFRDPSH